MKIAIMQPYFLPYIGYFQLINAVDQFVIYDNIQYTKKGWINRNRILVNGKDEFITLPLKKDSDYFHVNQRYLSDAFALEKEKITRKIKEVYRKAPYFNETFEVWLAIVNCKDVNLFSFILNALQKINSYLEIETPLLISSSIAIDHQLKAEDKVIAICKALQATCYLNPIGGVELYAKKSFDAHHLKLQFIQANPFVYQQFNHDFIPWLSILDVMMFNNKDVLQEIIKTGYKTIEN